MAEGDRQLAFTTGPVPTSVEVSGPDRITPKTVNASFDGTGAAGDFLPCLIITGRTGLEVARIPAPQVAAGASAEVSWFPRVGGGTGSTPGALTATTEYARSGGTQVSPGNGNAPANSLPWLHSSGAALLDYTTPRQPTIIASGIYSIVVNAILATPVATSPSVMAVLFQAGPTAFLKGTCPLATNVFGGVVAVDTPEVTLTLPPINMNAGDVLNVSVRQGSGGNLTFSLQSPVGAIVTKLS